MPQLGSAAGLLAGAALSVPMLLGGCADGGSGEDTASTPTASEVEIAVEIQDGTVTPTGEQVPAHVGDTVVLVVDSDAADELHVHSTPEHEFEVAAADDQQFRLTVDQPGQVAVERHETDVLVAELVVEP